MFLPKIGIVSTDWSGSIVDKHGHPEPGGAGFIRLQQLRPHIQNTTVTGPLLFTEKTGFSVADFNGKVHTDCGVIILQRLMFKGLVETLRHVRSMPVRPLIINDLDDWYWGLHPNNAAFNLVNPNLNKDENLDHYLQILELSDIVVVSTPFLLQKMKKLLKNPSVVMIENCVSTQMFSVRRLSLKKPIIGWVGSTSHRSNDLEELRGVFVRSDRLHHSGHIDGAPLFWERVDGVPNRVSLSPMNPPHEYMRKSFCFDIGLAPLSDIDFNKAKSWIKMIEYAAAGVPAVCSPSPEYVRLYEEYGIGRIAHSKDEWRSHIDELQNTRVRNIEAKANRDRVRALDVTKMASQWATLLQGHLA
jgi:glycosyltransferase involved in cell wall biosynthesis